MADLIDDSFLHRRSRRGTRDRQNFTTSSRCTEATRCSRADCTVPLANPGRDRIRPPCLTPAGLDPRAGIDLHGAGRVRSGSGRQIARVAGRFDRPGRRCLQPVRCGRSRCPVRPRRHGSPGRDGLLLTGAGSPSRAYFAIGCARETTSELRKGRSHTRTAAGASTRSRHRRSRPRETCLPWSPNSRM